MNKQEALTIYRSPAEVENEPEFTPKQAVELVKMIKDSRIESVQLFWKKTVEPEIKEKAATGEEMACFFDLNPGDVRLLIKHAKSLGWKAHKGSDDSTFVVEWKPNVMLPNLIIKSCVAIFLIAIFLLRLHL